jgi:hypothetical protein
LKIRNGSKIERGKFKGHDGTVLGEIKHWNSATHRLLCTTFIENLYAAMTLKVLIFDNVDVGELL